MWTLRMTEMPSCGNLRNLSFCIFEFRIFHTEQYIIYQELTKKSCCVVKKVLAMYFPLWSYTNYSTVLRDQAHTSHTHLYRLEPSSMHSLIVHRIEGKSTCVLIQKIFCSTEAFVHSWHFFTPIEVVSDRLDGGGLKHPPPDPETHRSHLVRPIGQSIFPFMISCVLSQIVSANLSQHYPDPPPTSGWQHLGLTSVFSLDIGYY